VHSRVSGIRERWHIIAKNVYDTIFNSCNNANKQHQAHDDINIAHIGNAL
jgi:hypothetical protein